ncbi:cyclic nucleotide-binding domain-containing protein [Flavobacteriaceae bacterium R38]|nr:cyclic nucleotide-binding domain-containing protein [Flavobacteriaceae bacterium R38]
MVRTDKYITLEGIYKWIDTLNLEIDSMEVKKGDVFLKQGQKCDYFYFVIDGLIRMYYYDLDGNEVTHWFSSQNMMVTSPDSFFQKNENILNLEALEDSKLLLITYEHIEIASKEIPGFNSLFRKLLVDFIVKMSRRVMGIHTQSAEYRYLKLIEQYPNIFHRTKLSHIASYLGITIQSLSRIRKKLIS